jgi:hypothetical protein
VHSRLCLLAGAGVLVLASGVNPAAPEKKADPKQTRADVTAFNAYLAKNYPKKNWQTGPSRLDSAELRKAYGQRRYYFVFSSPPLPPGAALPDLLKRYQENIRDYQKNAISLTIAIKDKDRITPLSKLTDFNQGLMKVKTDADAKTAAAAIFSLYGLGRVSPGIVAAKEVTVTRKDKGWSCQVNKKNAFQGTVTFDAKGKCIGVSKIFIGPLPP